MATNSTPMDLQTLESARRHLQSLVTSLTSLRRDLDTNDPLPAYPSLLTSTSLIAMHISALANHLSSHADFFATAHATPLATFPGREQEVLLQQLLRKKMDPAVAEWVGEGEARARTVDGVDGADHSNGGKHLNGEERRQLWQWASPRAQELARRILVEGAGLGGDDDDDDDEEGEDDEDNGEEEAAEQTQRDGMELDIQDSAGTPAHATKPIMPLEDICRFMTTGAMPTQGIGSAGGIRPGIRPGAG